MTKRKSARKARGTNRLLDNVIADDPGPNKTLRQSTREELFELWPPIEQKGWKEFLRKQKAGNLTPPGRRRCGNKPR